MTAPLTAEEYNTEVRAAAHALTVAAGTAALKDTPANRAVVAVARKRLDTLFDQRGAVRPNPMDYHDAHK